MIKNLAKLLDKIGFDVPYTYNDDYLRLNNILVTIDDAKLFDITDGTIHIIADDIKRVAEVIIDRYYHDLREKLIKGIYDVL